MPEEMKVAEQIQEKKSFIKRFFEKYPVSDIALLIGWIMCVLCGMMPEKNTILSLVLFACLVVSWRHKNFYLFLALFMFFRELMLIGSSTVFRIYSYMLVIKLAIEIQTLKIRTVHIPVFLWFALYTVVAVGSMNLRFGFNIIVDLIIVYFVLIRILEDDELMRKFLFMIMLGGVASGVYGWTSDAVVEINVGRHKTSETISRYYGALHDANFAGFFYILCFITALDLKKIKIWLRIPLMGLFLYLLLQTGSLSSLITAGAMVFFWTVLKFRQKALIWGTGVLVLVAMFIVAIWTIPALNQIEIFSSIILRINERIVYLQQGRWDMLTTDRYSLWMRALDLFNSQETWKQFIGGNVITTMISESPLGSDFACHQTYIQGLLNFGIVGAVLVFGTSVTVFIYRIIGYLTKWYKNDNCDIKRLQILYMFAFFVFGFSVDFFMEWRYLFFYFI